MEKHMQQGEPILTEGDIVVEDGAVTPPEAKAPIARRVVLGVYGLLIVLGIGTGYLLSRTGGTLSSNNKPGMINTGKVAGVTDEKTFKDSAVGTVEKGGINGEGTHKLIREGGVSQTAFLISSVVDLDQYIGKKVKVWGQTFAAEKAAWLMDVGKIEIQQ
ncbi:MAG: hypothetical protein AAB457_01385 [Patescibacteria group bacterium]